MSDALKLRLNSLKKASVQLKSKVLNEPKINYESISAIMASILPEKEADQSLLTTPPQNNNSEAALARSKAATNSGSPPVSNTLTYSPTSSIFLVPASTIVNNSAPSQSMAARPLVEKVSRHERSSSNDSLISKDPLDCEIDKLRQQNEEIEAQMLQLAEDMRELRRKELVLEEESWKQNLPFLNETDSAGIFVTKLFIKEYDYDKIDYEEGQVELANDRLLVHLPLKAPREFPLASLSEVKYAGDRAIKVDFKVEETLFLFLEFKTPKERESCDLALFVNHKISSSKDLDRSLFMEAREELWLGGVANSKASLRQEEADDYKLLGEKSDRLRKNSSKVFDRRNQKANTNKSQTSSLKREDSFRNFNGIEYTLNGGEFQANDLYNTPHLSAEENPDRSFNEIVVFGAIGDSHQESRTNTSKFNLPEVTFPRIDAEDHEETKGMLTPDKMQEQLDTLKWETTLRELKEGYYFTKYAKDGAKPHNKKVFVTPEEDLLVSMSTTDSKDRKVIPIAMIKRLNYPGAEEGIHKFVEKVVPENYCVVVYLAEGKEKLMELGCHNTRFMARFVEQLIEFLHKKGIPLTNP